MAEQGKVDQNEWSGGCIYQFGSYELDPNQYQLRRSGKSLRLSGAPLNLLILLVKRRNLLVSREEIAASLWEEHGLVDVDQGINTAVRRIREVLLDDPAKPRFIETVVGRGYRFIAEVKEIEEDNRSLVAPLVTPKAEQAPSGLDPMPLPPPLPNSQLSAHQRLPQQRFRWIVAILLSSVLLLAIGIILFRRSSRVETVRWKAGSFVQVTTNDGEMRVTAAAISPDGKWIAYADRSGIYLRVLANGVTSSLRAPDNFHCENIQWYPGQLNVLLSGIDASDNSSQIWVASIAGATPRLLLKDAREGRPSPDGTRLLFTRNNDREIWVAGIDGEADRPLITGRFGQTFPVVFWSGDGRRISYLRLQDTLATGDYESVDANSGKLLASAKNLSFDSALALSSGRVIFLGSTEPSYGHSPALWDVMTDPSTGAFVSTPQNFASFGDDNAVDLTSSDGGTKLSVILEKTHPDVYVGTLTDAGTHLVDVQRLTYDTRVDYPHAWLPDNQTVIFESNRGGAFRIYKQRIQERTAQQLSTGSTPAVLPQVSPDGKWILYAAKPQVSPSPQDRLFRIPVDGGTPEQVPLKGPLDDFACPLSGGSGCVLRVTDARRKIAFFALDPIRGQGRELAHTAWFPNILGDWSVSPDGTTVALTSHNPADPRIRIVPLHRRSGESEREINVNGVGRLSAINWSADGHGWYVSANSATRTSLLYVSLTGGRHLLLNTLLSTWGVPSPDGRRLAFVDETTVDSNVWVWQATAETAR